jgi:hypothetical protein
VVSEVIPGDPLAGGIVSDPNGDWRRVEQRLNLSGTLR